jgi:hypothetical protein
MALAAGFEPANPFELPVFKTGGLNRTLPSKHIKVVATKLRMATQNITTMFFRRKSNQNTNIARLKKTIIAIGGGTPTWNRTKKSLRLPPRIRRVH